MCCVPDTVTAKWSLRSVCPAPTGIAPSTLRMTQHPRVTLGWLHCCALQPSRCREPSPALHCCLPCPFPQQDAAHSPGPHHHVAAPVLWLRGVASFLFHRQPCHGAPETTVAIFRGLTNTSRKNNPLVRDSLSVQHPTNGHSIRTVAVKMKRD